VTDLYREIHKAGLNLEGASFKVKRTTLLRGASLDVSKANDAFRHLLSLRRSLKVSANYFSVHTLIHFYVCF